MRIIGHVETEPLAQTFSDYLYVKGIKNQVEAETDGTWAIWIHAEDELEHARSLLRSFLANPNDASVKRTAERARELIAVEQEKAQAVQKRQFDRDRLFPTSGLRAMGPLTISLIAISIVVYLVREFSPAGAITDLLFISDPRRLAGDLPEVREGQVWRLLTPIFIHLSVLHILFNMLWMRDLGGMVERRIGSFQLLLMVVGIGIASNVAQYYMSGPAFGGMSGVVYGLLGYVWMRGRFDPDSGLFLHPSTVMMMLLWLVFGYANVLPVAMANTVHTVGLVSGAIWGIAAARLRS